MTKIFIFLLALFSVSICQQVTQVTTTEESEPSETTAGCIFSCLDAFQRKGAADDAATTEATLLDKGCGSLDFESLVDLCGNYQRAGTCLGMCVNSGTKALILGGLDYLCVHRFADFKKHLSCFTEQCSSLERTCGPRCGAALSTIETLWMGKLGADNKTDSDRSRRKRDDDDGTTTTSPDATSVAGTTTIGEDDAISPFEMCTFVKCYTNCSRPLMEQKCGKDAFELLKQTSRILLSFILVPLQIASSDSSAPSSASSGICDDFVAEALTVEKSGAIRLIQTWTVAIAPIAFFIVRRLI